MTILSIRGVPLFVDVVGRGYPLALMHGGPGQDYTSLLPLKPLGDRFSLVFYDHRCNGQSVGADQSTMTMENLTADADALRQALGFEKWAVLGHSFGGQVALEYALRYPDSLSNLIVMNGGGDNWWVEANSSQLLARRGYRPAAVEATRRFFNGEVTPATYYSAFFKFMLAYFYRFPFLKYAREIATGPKIFYRPEATIFGYRHVVNGWTVMDRLGEIRVPTLVIAGRWDFLFPPEHQAILADRLPHARLELVERAGHNPHIERQAEVIRTIRDFLGGENPAQG
jgi:proline iminopeptidase